MGSNCCCHCKGAAVESDQGSVMTLADLGVQDSDLNETTMEETRDNVEPSEQVTELNETTMEETRDNVAPTEQEPSSLTLRHSEVVKRIESQEGTSNTKESTTINLDHVGYNASNILWTTQSFSDPIPNGFYSVIPNNRLKLFENIPTMDELHALRDKDIKTDVILIDFAKDQTLFRLKQLIITLVRGSNLKPVAVIKKIVGLVSDVYKNPTKATQLEFPMLGQIKHGSCRARAMLFKVLADAVGVESRIVMGFPSDQRSSASVDSYKHMSIVVVLNTMEFLVDLVRSPGQLILLSDKVIYAAHTSPPGNASCDSPLASNSPTYRTNHGRSARAARNRESLKQRSLLKERPDAIVSGSHHDSRSQVSGERSKLDQRKVISLPSSLQNYRSQRRREDLRQNINQIWNKVLESQKFQNKPLLPYEEWNIDYSELIVETRVGVGSFGIVYRGTWNGINVAVKNLLKRNLAAEDMEDFCNEISILSRLRHPNVVLFLGACTKPPQLSIVTELIRRGSLYDILHSPKQEEDLSNWQVKLKIMRDICRGLMYTHRMGIVHRDLKSANCLVTSNWKVKICDFGLSIVMKGKTMKATVSPGTPEWMAPELIRKEDFSEKCDIFSFGVIMWEICTLSKPWKGIPIETVIRTVAKEGGRLEIPEGPVGKLIADCWSEPEQRPSCREILSRLLLCETYLHCE